MTSADAAGEVADGAPNPSDEEGVADAGSKAGDIRNLEELLVFAYKQQGKRFSLPANVLDAIASRRHTGEDDSASDPALDLILGLAESDPLLLVPPRLLIAAEDGRAPHPLSRHLASLVSGVLRRHPAFEEDDIQLALTTAPRDRDQVFDAVASAVSRVPSARLRIGDRELKPLERDKLRTNAATTLAMVLAIRDRWSLDEFVNCLDAHLWRPTRKGDRESRAMLADSRTPDALAAVAGVYAALARRAEARAADADEYSQQASRRAAAAEAEVEDRDRQLGELSRDIETLRSEIKTLEATLVSERKNRVVDRSHHVDDYDALRTRIVRMLDRQTELLADGLHALKHGSHGVTEEYLERAVDALAKERDQLKAEGVGDG